MSAERTRPNVILILSDDQGYGDLGCFGNDDIRTPHLDRLADEGVRLTQHYTCSPICAPDGSVSSGSPTLMPNRGLDRISLRDMTIADVFKRAGYATGMVGKWHNGLHDMRFHPNSRGFDEFAGFLNGGMDYWDWILDYNGTPRRSDGRYLTDVFTDEAAAFIDRHRAEPFFLYLAYNAPHSPLQAPEEDVKPFAETGKFNAAVSTLYGMIRRMDAGIGRVLDALTRLGLADNTIVLFSSDNGPVLSNQRVGPENKSMSTARYNGPFRGMKYDVLEGGIRVPAILRWPDGLPADGECHDMIHFCDWLPTLLSACDLDARPELPLDGGDALPALRGERGKLPTKRFWQFNRYDPVLHCNAAIRDGDWKLYWPWIPEAKRKLQSDNEPYRRNFTVPHFLMQVENPPVERDLSAPGEPELYNIAADVYEQHDLAATHPDRVSRMRRDFETWFEQVEAERRALPPDTQ